MFKERERERKKILSQLRALLIFLAVLAGFLAYFIYKFSQDLAFALILPLFLLFFFYLPLRSKKIFKVKRIFAQIIQELVEEENREFIYKENLEEELSFPSFYAKAKIGFAAHELKINEVFLCSLALFYEDRSAKPEFRKVFEGLYLTFPMEENFKKRMDIKTKNDQAFSPYKESQNKALGELRAYSEGEEKISENFLARIKAFYKEIDQEFALSSLEKKGELFINLGFPLFAFSPRKKISAELFREDILFLRKVLAFVKDLN